MGRRYFPETLQKRDIRYLAGFWESWRYLKPLKDTLRDEFRVVEPMSDEDQAVADEIDDAQSVDVHVRRGDKGELHPPPILRKRREGTQTSR